MSAEAKAPEPAPAGCCPPGSLPKLPTGTYTPRGSELKLGDLPVYTVGERSTVGIIVVQDAFGPNSGRHKWLCDLLADNGFVVAIADYHRAYPCDMSTFTDPVKRQAWIDVGTWPIVKKDVDTHIIPLLKSKGATKFGAVGFCWGSWPVLHMAGEGHLAAAAWCHPSHHFATDAHKENLAELLAAVQCPVLSYTAGNDNADAKPGGADEKAFHAKPFGSKCESKEFADMKHGWVVRAELDDPTNHRDVQLAVGGLLDFFKKNLLTA